MSEHCVICGAEVPEGRQVCARCEESKPAVDLQKALDGVRHCLVYTGACTGCPYEDDDETGEACMEMLMRDVSSALQETMAARERAR